MYDFITGKDEDPENIFEVFVTLVFKFDKSIVSNISHPKNILLVSYTFSIGKLDKLILIKFEQF